MWTLKLRGVIPSSSPRWLTNVRNAVAAVNPISNRPVSVIDSQGFPNSRQSIVTLDRELRRFGRIRTDHYTNALNDAVEQKFLTAQHAVLLLRSLGSALSDEPPAVRINLVQSLWKQLETLGVKPDVGLFNALLQTYIENDHFEQPSIFLEKMKAANVSPNRVTYQRIVGLYCLKGDINAASTVLNHMKSEGHPVNEALFAHLIHGHIRAGDVAGAKSIFETMRKAGIEPTAASFSMLMLGFAERGDIEAIQNARKLAADSNCLLLPRDFIPTIVSLSKNGYSDKIPAILEMITNHVGYNRDMMAGILQLCSLRKFDEAISIFWTLRRPSPSVSGSSVAEGSQMEHQTENSDTNATPMLFGRFLVRSLIKHRAPVDLIASTMHQMRERGVNTDTALDAARISAEFGRADQFREWMTFLRKDDLLKPALRQHMFWPLFRILERSKDTTVEAVLEAVNEMKSFNVNLEHNSFVTLGEFLMPAFARAVGGDKNLISSVGNSEPGVLAKLELAGYQADHISFSYLVYLVKRGFMAEAKAHLSTLPKLLVSPAYLSEYLANYLRDSKTSLQPVVDILALLEKNPNIVNPDNIELLVGKTFIEAIFARRSAEWPASVIESFANAGLKPSAGNIRAARIELERRNSSKELLSQLDKIASKLPQTTSRTGEKTEKRSRMDASDAKEALVGEDDSEELGKMTAEQLESMLAKVKDSKGSTLRIEKHLLMRYCQQGDVSKAESLKAKLDSKKFVYPPSMLRSLLTLAAAHKQSLPESISMKEKLEAAGGMPSPGATIDIVALEVKSGKPADDVFQTLREYAEKQAHMLTKRQMGQSMLLYRPASRLVQAFVDIGQHKNAAKAMLTLIESSFISPRCQVLGDICVDAFVKAKDWEGLVDLVESMTRKHKTVIAANDVLSALIQAGDEHKAKLQRCIEAMSACQGEMATLNTLIVSLVECGKLNEARKVLETPGLRALPRYLSWACENLASKGKYDSIVALVGVVRGLYNADVEDMYFRLIKAYGRPGKSEKSVATGEPGWKKALKVYERFEEESVQPRPRTLRYLADILVDNGQPVPFQVPQVSTRQVSTSSASVASNTSSNHPIESSDSVAILKHVRRAVELLSRGKVGEVVEIRSQLDHAVNSSEPKTLGATFVRLLVQQLIDKHSHDLLVKLSSTLASSGAIDDLSLLREVANNRNSQPLPEWCWEKLSVDFALAHDKAGKIDDYVQMLSVDSLSVGDLRRYLTSSALSVIRKSSSSSAWNNIEKIIRKSAGNLSAESPNIDGMSLLNRLWTNCIHSKDFARAQGLEKDYPQLLERPPLAGILRQVKSLPSPQEAIPIFDHLLTSFKDRANHAAFVLSYALPMLANSGDWVGVRQRVKAMETAGIRADSLRPVAIAQLQQAAEREGIQLPDELANLPKQALPVDNKGVDQPRYENEAKKAMKSSKPAKGEKFRKTKANDEKFAEK